MSSSLLKYCAAALLCLASPAMAANEVVAVLSSGGGAYLEAFSAFQAAYGAEVTYFDVSREKPALPPGTKVVVAFGTKAATYPYPPGTDIVYCMAPGAFVPQQGRQGRTIKISMVPDMRLTISKIKQTYPQLRRLRAFWMVPGFGAYADDLKKAGEAVGVEVTPVKVEKIDDLPGILRGGLGGMDAFWLPPDPLLISPESLMIFREFSWNNRIPMYATTKGLVREGACASVGISFAESGAAAAANARALLAGENPPPVFFTDKIELVLNASAAKRCGLQFPQEAIKDAAYLFP